MLFTIPLTLNYLGETAIINKDSLEHHILPDYKKESNLGHFSYVNRKLWFLVLTTVYCPSKHKIIFEIFRIVK
jgi:hypothetical protein